MKGKIVTVRGVDHYYIDGKEVTKKKFDKAFPSKGFAGGTFGGTPTTGWPLLSKALGVHPDQVEEARADAKAKGVPVDVRPDGHIEFSERAQRKAYLKAYGYRDNDGGYGD